MDDLIEEIVLRLPLKSVFRCKLLSKQCRNFISHNSSFRETYLSRNQNCSSQMLGFFIGRTVVLEQDEPLRFLATTSDGRRRRQRRDSLDESLSFLGLPTVHLWASSKGFLLCSEEFLGPQNYFICNPINKQWISLPEPCHTAMLLTHGFISNGTNQHTVVCSFDLFLTGPHSQILTLEMFTSVSPHQWKQIYIDCGFFFGIDLSFKPSPIITEQGLMIFPVVLGEDQRPPFYRALIVFDQTKDEDCIQLLEFPVRPLLPVLESGCLLGQSDGLVLYACYKLGVFKIWQLSESKAGHTTTKRAWSLKDSFTMNITVENYPELSEEIYRRVPVSLHNFHPTNPRDIFISIGSKNFLVKLGANPRLELICDFEEQGFRRDSDYCLFPYSYVWA